MSDPDCRNCHDREIGCLDCQHPKCGGPWGAVVGMVSVVLLALAWIWS